MGNVINFVNVRSTPSTSLKEISTLKKDSTVSAKPSSTSGWMELCDMQGFVSSKFLTLENSTSSNTTTTTTNESEGAKIFKKNIEEQTKGLSPYQIDYFLNKPNEDSIYDNLLILQNNVKLYEYPSLSSNVIDTLPKCTILITFEGIFGEREFDGMRDWYRVKYKNKIGFVKVHINNKRVNSTFTGDEINNFIVKNRNTSYLNAVYQKLANCPPPYYSSYNTKG